jgi:hypothetical protein
MHSKQTVKYIVEEYPSGRKLFFKQELVTMGSWNNIESLYWTRPRPITERTFQKQKKAGFPTEHRLMKNKPADIVFLTPRNDAEERGGKRVRRKRKGATDGSRTARARWLLRGMYS